MDGFWKQTFCHFKPRVFSHNYSAVSAIPGVIAAILTLVIHGVFAAVAYVPLSLYKGFAPHRMLLRYRSIQLDKQKAN